MSKNACSQKIIFRITIFRYPSNFNFFKEDPRTKMLAHVSGMDESVGKIIESYKRHGFWDNTILIFSSDNGGSKVSQLASVRVKINDPSYGKKTMRFFRNILLQMLHFAGSKVNWQKVEFEQSASFILI